MVLRAEALCFEVRNNLLPPSVRQKFNAKTVYELKQNLIC